MGNMHTVNFHQASYGREAVGDDRDVQPIHARYIEINLKRAYQATLSEQLPPRFQALIEALRKKEEGK